MHTINKIGIVLCFFSVFMLSPDIMGEARLQQISLRTINASKVIVAIATLVGLVSVWLLGYNFPAIHNYVGHDINHDWLDFMGPICLMSFFGIGIGGNLLLNRLDAMSKQSQDTKQWKRSTITIGTILLTVGSAMQFIAA